MCDHPEPIRPADILEPWSQVTVVIPAFLNNECGILDETLRTHARLAYRGPLTVLLVYNKGPAGAAGPRLEEAEHQLLAAWAGREEGNIRCACRQTAYCLDPRHPALTQPASHHLLSLEVHLKSKLTNDSDSSPHTSTRTLDRS